VGTSSSALFTSHRIGERCTLAIRRTMRAEMLTRKVDDVGEQADARS
jgi:hypothetical protein